MILTKNAILLDNDKVEKLTEKLNEVLSDYQVYYQNLRGLHWNIKGKFFFNLHEKFEEYYNEAAENIDELAERILTLGGTPHHTYEDYLVTTKLKAEKNVGDPDTALKVIVDNNQKLLTGLREVLSVANEADDEGTNALASDLIRTIEKRLWMLGAALQHTT